MSRSKLETAGISFPLSTTLRSREHVKRLGDRTNARVCLGFAGGSSMSLRCILVFAAHDDLLELHQRSAQPQKCIPTYTWQSQLR